MPMQNPGIKKLVLLGAGHAHVHVLSRLAQNRPADLDVTVVTPYPFQTYSGMTPGLVAGRYETAECQIPLEPLVKAAGAKWVQARCTGLDANQQLVRLAAAGDHVLGHLSPIGAARGFPLRLIRVPNPIASRVALIGDAAHGIHPLSGHGINLGFSDARELAAAIADCPAGGDVGHGRVLRRYRRRRAEEVRLFQETTHGLRQLFASEAPGLSLLRNLGLSVTDRLPRVKSLLTRYAMG